MKTHKFRLLFFSKRFPATGLGLLKTSVRRQQRAQQGVCLRRQLFPESHGTIAARFRVRVFSSAHEPDFDGPNGQHAKLQRAPWNIRRICP
jgi:hypothetical protein